MVGSRRKSKSTMVLRGEHWGSDRVGFDHFSGVSYFHPDGFMTREKPDVVPS